MKAPAFKAARVPMIEDKCAETQITRAELLALLVDRVARNTGDSESLMRNRLSSRVCTAIKGGKLRAESSGCLQLGAVRAWATPIWPRSFDDLPTFSSGHISGGATLPGLGSGGEISPATIEKYQAENQVLRAECAALTAALSEVEDRVRELAPKATNWDRWIGKKRGKRPPKKVR